MTELEHQIQFIANKNRRVFRALTAAYLARVKPDERTLRDFKRIPAIDTLRQSGAYSDGEIARAVTTVIEQIVMSQESA